MAEGGRYRELDALRGIAAMAVVISHLTGNFDLFFPEYPPLGVSFAYGGLGVQLFFMISGYVILMTARRYGDPSEFFKGTSRASLSHLLGVAHAHRGGGLRPRVRAAVPTVGRDRRQLHHAAELRRRPRLRRRLLVAGSRTRVLHPSSGWPSGGSGENCRIGSSSGSRWHGRHSVWH